MIPAAIVSVESEVRKLRNGGTADPEASVSAEKTAADLRTDIHKKNGKPKTNSRESNIAAGSSRKKQGKKQITANKNYLFYKNEIPSAPKGIRNLFSHNYSVYPVRLCPSGV